MRVLCASVGWWGVKSVEGVIRSVSDNTHTSSTLFLSSAR